MIDPDGPGLRSISAQQIRHEGCAEDYVKAPGLMFQQKQHYLLEIRVQVKNKSFRT